VLLVDVQHGGGLMRVLVCEKGNAAARVSAALTRALVVHARTPTDAVHYAQRNCPDAIIIAPGGRREHWIDWIPALRAACQTAAVVVLVDAFDENDGQAAIAAGANVYAEKWPFALRRLIYAACATASAARRRAA